MLVKEKEREKELKGNREHYGILQQVSNYGTGEKKLTTRSKEEAVDINTEKNRQRESWLSLVLKKLMKSLL